MFSLNNFQKVLFFKCNVSLKLTTENTISISNTCRSHTALFLHKAATFCSLMPNTCRFCFCSYTQYILRLLFNLVYLVLCLPTQCFHASNLFSQHGARRMLSESQFYNISLIINWWFTRNSHFIKVNSSSSVWVLLVLRTGGTLVVLPFAECVPGFNQYLYIHNTSAAFCTS